MKGVRTYLSNPWNVLDWTRSIALYACFAMWVYLTSGLDRDIDLDMLEFVELESVARVVKLYNVFYNIVVLFSLFSMLQYTGLDDRMALLTLSIYNSMGDLIPFMLLFIIFILFFGLIGYALYGPLLLEFSTIPASLVTVIDMICGNYVFTSLEAGLDKG